MRYTLKYHGYELMNSNRVSRRYATMPNIPDDATEFYCENSSLTTLPNLPADLNVLHCDHNLLENLPNLPPELNALHCSYNRLTVLPPLPNTMMANSYLYCDHNLLENLPTLPDNLVELNCSHNKLVDLVLPDRLSSLHCGHNKLERLSINEQLTILHCEHNQLKDFPVLPDYMTELRLEGNPLNRRAIKDYGLYVLNNPGVRHDLNKFVSADYGRSHMTLKQSGKMRKLPYNVLRKISNNFIKAGKTHRKKRTIL